MGCEVYVMEDFSGIIQALSSIREAYGAGAAMGIAVAVFAALAKTVDVAVEIWSKWEWVQEKLPEQYRWQNMSKWKKWGIVVIASTLVSLSGSLGLGLGLKAALLATAQALIPIALGALGTHSGSKRLGSAIDGRAQAKIQAGSGSGKDLSYEPSKYRAIMDPLIPIDWSKYPQSKKILDAIEEMKAPRE